MKRLLKKDNAKQVGILYHYTSIASILAILQEDRLKSNAGDISFTRNQNFHSNDRTVGDRIEGRIVIDGNKLSENYKIKPYSDQDYIEDEIYDKDKPFYYHLEQEERIRFQDCQNLHGINNYIIKIEILSKVLPKRYDYPFYGTFESYSINNPPNFINFDFIKEFINYYDSSIEVDLI